MLSLSALCVGTSHLKSAFSILTLRQNCKSKRLLATQEVVRCASHIGRNIGGSTCSHFRPVESVRIVGCESISMGHTAPAANSPVLTKRQRRKTFKVQPDLTQLSVASADSLADELEPQNCNQQLSTSRSFRDGAAAQSSASSNDLLSGYQVSMPRSHMHTQVAAKQAAATTTAQALVLQPALGLAAPSTGWLSDSVKIADRVLSLLNACGAMKVSQDLHTLGYPELVAHRACLEVQMLIKHVDVDACVKWIKQQPDLSSLNRYSQGPQPCSMMICCMHTPTDRIALMFANKLSFQLLSSNRCAPCTADPALLCLRSNFAL